MLSPGDPTDVQTKSLNVDLLAETKRAWDGLMALLGFACVLCSWWLSRFELNVQFVEVNLSTYLSLHADF